MKLNEKVLIARQLTTIQNMIDTILISLKEPGPEKPKDEFGRCGECGSELVDVSSMNSPDTWMCPEHGERDYKIGMEYGK